MSSCLLAAAGLVQVLPLRLNRVTTIEVIGVRAENVHGMAASYYAGEITTHRTTGFWRGWFVINAPAREVGNLTCKLIS